MIRRAGRVVLLLLMSGLLMGGWLEPAGQRSIPTVTYTLDALERPVEILVDPWGIPHIYAGQFGDVFFAQGFNAARDRLWQIDLWRRRGLGRLSEVFGAGFVEKDRAARLLLYRGDMQAEWNSYSGDARQIATSFVAGINAYVGLTLRDPSLMPPEFKLLSYEPALWSPEDVVRIRIHGLWRNLRQEVGRAERICKLGLPLTRLWSRLEPPWELELPDGLEPCSVSREVLKVYRLAFAPVDFSQPDGPQPETVATTGDDADGSNNWALAPGRTATGRAIVANDPHRAITLPSLRYAAHLVAPGLDVIGAGEPFLPGISIGHNGKVGFGLTIFPIDQEDLYIYQTRPDNADQYRYGEGWEAMRIIDEEIAVRGRKPEQVRLKFTRHGPVLYEEPTRRLAYAGRLAWLEPGMAPYFGSIASMRASTAREFVTALKRWGGPSLNHVGADLLGKIFWKPWGRAPIRQNWDGLLPVPGDGRYEWKGFYQPEQFPVEFSPARGWVASANQMNLPENFPYRERKLGFEWTAPWRFQRIKDTLGAARRSTLVDSVRLQTDYLSVSARRLLELAKTLKPGDQKAAEALKELRSWDFVLSPDSRAALIFEVWLRRHLAPAIARKLLGDVPPEDESPDAGLVLKILERPPEQWGSNPVAVRDETLRSTLQSTIEEIERRLGSDREKWRWGAFHHTFLEHPLARRQSGTAQDIFPGGRRAPRGGSGDTVGNTSYRNSDFRQTNGASWRMVLDVGNWDASLAMNTPGQSGDPSSPHYDDLYLRWVRDQAFPLLYSRSAIERVAEERILLKPR